MARFFARHYDGLTAATERHWLAAHRAALVGPLRGRVLEIGAGTGANLPYYRDLRCLTVVEPSPAMRDHLRNRLDTAAVPVDLVDATAERLPFPAGAFDAVVCTLVLCSVDDPAQAVAEIRRVLAPWGRLVFLEHVRDSGLRGRIQHLVTPVHRRLAAGCHPDRDTVAALRAGGFELTSLEVFRPPAVGVARPVAEGTAVLPHGQYLRELHWLSGGS